MYYIPAKSLTDDDMALIKAYSTNNNDTTGKAWEAHEAHTHNRGSTMSGEYETSEAARSAMELLAHEAAALYAFEGNSIEELILSPDTPSFEEIKIKKCVTYSAGIMPLRKVIAI